MNNDRNLTKIELRSLRQLVNERGIILKKLELGPKFSRTFYKLSSN